MKELIISGFGGQGILTTGLIMADIALANGMYATWIPSYGAEMRGGRAYCIVKMDPVRVGTPALEEADLLLAMNIPALTFTEQMKSGGTLIVNEDLIPDYRNYMARTDLNVIEVPIDSIASMNKLAKGANVIAAGLISALLKNIIDKETATAAMLQYFEDKGKQAFAASNRQAFETGFSYIK